ncbi:Eukaryotic translation initiation factor 4 gamma [Wickerhamiella sorbophila]|uniref:Eukaryotic translation initiation factor 4 gamma n=1 Tax=Wickerhamiella sorbophila TaxID=45607 RepID=A0A2T0FKI1_9ASCO|nr:Eukaryotic translation initiation factor 4 gamma [Wickerhamiella sorbophila]PRT55485.1 Eukaryotic translation initiation factor 4 gamma [Wickerhamiella sorbophila]
MSTPQQPSATTQSSQRPQPSGQTASSGGNSSGQPPHNGGRNNQGQQQIPQGPQGGQGGNQGHTYSRRGRGSGQYGNNRSRGGQNGHHNSHSGHNNHNNGGHTGHHRMASNDGQAPFQRGHRNTGSGYFDPSGGMPPFSAYPGQYVPLAPNLMPYQMMPMGSGVPPSPGVVPMAPVMSPQAAHLSPHMQFNRPALVPQHAPIARAPVRLTNAQGEEISLTAIAHTHSPRVGHAQTFEPAYGSPAVSKAQVPSPGPVTASPTVQPKKAEPVSGAAKTLQELIAQKLKAEIAAKSKGEPNSVSEPASKVEVAGDKAEPKAKAKVETKAETKVETKAEPKVETKVEPKAEPQVESNVEPKTEANVEHKTESKVEPKVEPKAEPKVEPKAEPKVEAKVEPKVEAKVEAKVEPKVEAKVEPKAEPKVEPKVEAKVEAKVEPKAEPKAEPVIEADTKVEPKVEQESTLEEKVECEPTDEPSVKDDDVSPHSSPKLSASEPKESQEEPKEEAKEEAKDDAEDEAFVERLGTAERLPVEKVATFSYPAPIVNSAASNKTYRYDIAFLRNFATAVPVMFTDLRKRVEIDVGRGPGGRAMSQRGARQGSHAGFGSMREGRMSRNSSTTNFGSRSGRQGSRRKDRGSNRHDHKDDKPAVPVEPLKRSENAWQPRFSQTKAEDAASENQLMSQEEVARKVKSLLNKMTLENFERISKQVYEIAEQSKYEDDGETLRHVIELTLAKAVDEPHWSAMYAAFCLQSFTISEDITDKASMHTDENGNAVPVGGPRLFRRYLLTRCQTEFEKGWTSKIPVGEDGQQAGVMSDEYYTAVKAKRHGLGIIRFIGELYKVGFLSPRIIVRCFVKLVNEEPNEDIVESMCKLVITVAQRMEKDGSGSAIDNAMKKLAEWKNTQGFPARLRFMIMDVEDTRRKGWKSKDADKGPKTISQIHTDIAKEQRAAEEEKARSQRGNRQNTLGRDRGNHDPREDRRERDERRERDREQRQARLAQQTKDSIDREQSMSGRRQSAVPAEPIKAEPKINRFSALGDD